MKPRGIYSKDIRIGDTIEITYVYADVTKKIQGKVRRRDRATHSTDYSTERGHVLLTVFRSGDTHPPNIQSLVLISRADETESRLPGFDELLEAVAE